MKIFLENRIQVDFFIFLQNAAVHKQLNPKTKIANLKAQSTNLKAKSYPRDTCLQISRDGLNSTLCWR